MLSDTKKYTVFLKNNYLATFFDLIIAYYRIKAHKLTTLVLVILSLGTYTDKTCLQIFYTIVL